MPIPIDILIIGAGVQGLLLLRRLVQDYSVVVVDSDPHASETLRSHGYFASGWNAAHPEAARIYRGAAEWWREFLERHRINPQENLVYRTAPSRTLARLSAAWRAAGIPFFEAPLPAPFDLSPWPTHKAVTFTADLVFDAAAAIGELRQPFERHLIEGRACFAHIDGDTITEVTVATPSGEIAFAPNLVCAAGGAGNVGILHALGLPENVFSRSQVWRTRHIVCARGAALPSISAIVQELTIIAHPHADGEVVWLITYDPPRPQFTSGTLDMTREPDISSTVVRSTFDKLRALIPGFDEIAASCQWDIYAGRKVDAPGDDPAALLKISLPKPYDARSFGLRNFFAVWPNHWGLAAPASQDVAAVVRESLPQRFDMPELPRQTYRDRDARKMTWARSDRPWRRWQDIRLL
jgi:glycine/D-amino acid oxidase-like deaminating enzyme